MTVVTSALRRSAAPAALLAAAVALSGCAGTVLAPDEPSDVRGVVADGGSVDDDARAGQPVVVQASDPYYEGMALLTDGTEVLAADGDAADPDILVAGVLVEVWVDEVCQESYPVQCDVEVVQLLEP
ncbi:hypothetical protein [Isoptericola sp. b408]|uniref:hypothetical protein n=1 Tax=Isoptericola sp. b408 TaxID=3064653 RepID=UPI0027136F32|nr:hypothetical protein [Isoptericola sp. b408]MDO8151514.1 hypothetical protein [Isoptericola sp. b408]